MICDESKIAYEGAFEYGIFQGKGKFWSIGEDEEIIEGRFFNHMCNDENG